MLQLYFWVEVAPQLSGYRALIQAATVTEMVKKIQSLQDTGYDGYAIDPFSYELKKDGIIICEGTYKNIIEKMNSM